MKKRDIAALGGVLVSAMIGLSASAAPVIIDISANGNPGTRTAVSTLDGMTHALSGLGSSARLAAISRLTGMTQQQSMVMAFDDIFLLLTLLFLALVVAQPLVNKPAAQGGGGGH